MGASLALAGLTACTRQPTEHIMPYVRQPEELIPGRPLFFATAMTLGGVANGRAGGEPRRAAHQDRGQPGASRPRWARAMPIRRHRCCSSTIRTARRRSRFKGEIRSWGEFLRQHCASVLAQQQAKSGGGHPHPHRDHHFADHGRPARARSRSCIPAPSGISGSPPGRTARAPRPRWPSAQPVNTYYNLSERERGRLARFRFPGVRSRPACATRGSSPRGGACAERKTRHEPAVRGGADADADRHQGRPSPAAARRRIEEFAWALATGLGAAQRPEAGRESRCLQVARRRSRAICSATRARAW